jgi:hypothetical protein
MYLLRRYLLCLLALTVLLVPLRSEAVEVRLGLGGHYWVDRGALFDLNLSLAAPVLEPLSIGGRFGLMLETGGNSVGLPLDILLRLRLGRSPLYLEGTFGPWIFFSGDTFRGHAALGFGAQVNSLSIGVEAGVLGSDALLGLRLGLRF